MAAVYRAAHYDWAVKVDVALKEWQVVCDALVGGEQSILLRKGGIQEGPGGFAMTHDRFALLPTRLHQKVEMLKPVYRNRIDGGDVEPARFTLTHAAEVQDITIVESRAALDELPPHVWAEPYLEMRWNYRPARPLYLVTVKTVPLAEPFELTNDYTVAGCKSWVPLPLPLHAGCV